MTDHLVIPDTHADPDHPNDRFRAIGNYILEHKPEVIVHLGDFAEFNSLSGYDKGLRKFEGRRLMLDQEAAWDAQEKLWEPLNRHNATKRMWKERQYLPRRILLGGNHDEGRIERMTQVNPEWTGMVSVDTLGYTQKDWWDEYVPYTVEKMVDGITYCHHLPSGVMGRPQGGIHHAHQLLQKNHKSCTVGHSHTFDMKTDVSPINPGLKIRGLVAGCALDFTPEYAQATAKYWTRMIVHKRNVRDGDYDIEVINLDRLMREYL